MTIAVNNRLLALAMNTRSPPTFILSNCQKQNYPQRNPDLPSEPSEMLALPADAVKISSVLDDSVDNKHRI